MIIALDIGTTGVKATAFNKAGKPVVSAARNNQTISTQFGWSEQDPEAVFQQVQGCILEIQQKLQVGYPADPPEAIVFSAAMHGLLAVDVHGKPLIYIMLWSDLRAAEEAKALLESGKGKEIYQRTGVPVHPMSPLVKLIWLRKNRPDVFQNAHKFLGIKDYIWFKLTGKFEVDLSCASASGLMNLRENVWDELALSLAGIEVKRLPSLVTPTHCQADKIPLIIGASDGALANLGSGAVQPGHLAITIGTSAALRMMTRTPLLDAHMRTFCYRVDESRFIVGGASNNGTNVLEWLRTQVFYSPLSPDEFANQAMLAPPGADGLRFMPYVYGERAPLWDATARASFEGLTSRHTQAHILRAAMEGIIHNLKTIAEVLEESYSIEVIHASGGFTRNKLWLNMLEEIFRKEVLVDSSEVDASVRGAFLLGTDALQL